MVLTHFRTFVESSLPLRSSRSSCRFARSSERTCFYMAKPTKTVLNQPQTVANPPLTGWVAEVENIRDEEAAIEELKNGLSCSGAHLGTC